MGGKNDKVILGLMVAIGVVAIASAATAFGIGAFFYANAPSAAPTPAPSATPAPTPTIVPSASDPFYLDRVISDRGARTYTLIMTLAPGAAPVDISKVTAEIVADGQTYPAWDYRHSWYGWSAGSDGDLSLEPGETLTMTIYTPQAGLPLDASSPVRIILLVDGVPACTIDYVVAV